MDDDVQEPSMNLYPNRRRQSSKPVTSSQIDTSPYFTPSQRKTTRREDDDRDEPSPSKPAMGRPRQRQGVLAFSNGQLTTKRPLVNPISRDDERRRTLTEVAEETWTLLPGLLATRPDVTNDSYMCRKETLDPAKHPQLKRTRVRVIDSDTIDAALDLQSGSAKPIAILNMANAFHPGGGWQHGAWAQEEAICYRSSLSKTLDKKHYPIPDDAALYSPTVMIIRKSMMEGHGLLDFRDPRKLPVVSVISSAAVCRPFLKKDAHGRPVYRDQRDAELMKEKIRVILRTAIRNRHRQLVLGALGCGAFGNPNYLVAAMFKDVLREQEFQGGYWRDLVFAVLDGKGIGNCDVFYDVLDGLPV